MEYQNMNDFTNPSDPNFGAVSANQPMPDTTLPRGMVTPKNLGTLQSDLCNFLHAPAVQGNPAPDPRFIPPLPPGFQQEQVPLPSFAARFPAGADVAATPLPANGSSDNVPPSSTPLGSEFDSYPADEVLYETIDKCRAAIVAAHKVEKATHLYDMDGKCAFLQRDAGKVRIVSIEQTAAHTALIKEMLTRIIRFNKRMVDNDGNETVTRINPPNDVAKAFQAGARGLPKLLGIIDLPVVREDGTIIDQPGYDPSTGLYYDPGDLDVPVVPVHPSNHEVEKALEELTKPFQSFPFQEDADRANYLGLLLTPIMRAAIGGNVPLVVISSPVQGAGKSKLAYCVNTIASGGKDGAMTAPERGGDDEMRKRLTASLLGRPQTLVIDNLIGRLNSPTLASILTTGQWSDRRLGSTEMVKITVRTSFIVTGVNVEVAEDMSRRCVYVRIDPATDKPWERRFDFDPEVHVRQHRAQLVGALHTIIRHWYSRGKAPWKGLPPGSFEEWAKTIGGILQTAGVDGFLDNRGTADDSATRELDALAAFFIGWFQAFGSQPQRSAELVNLLTGPKHRCPQALALRDGLLEEMMPIIDQTEGRAATKMAAVLRKYRDRIAGGLRLVSSQCSHTKHMLWSVVPSAQSEY